MSECHSTIVTFRSGLHPLWCKSSERGFEVHNGESRGRLPRQRFTSEFKQACGPGQSRVKTFEGNQRSLLPAQIQSATHESGSG